MVGTTHHPERAGSLSIEGRAIPVIELALSEQAQVEAVVRRYEPAAIYNFAARASSSQLFDDPLGTTDINGVAVVRLLEAVRSHSPKTRLCQASSSEIFAGAQHTPQDESTPRLPLNAYGAAKAFADHMVAAYRAAHGLFACSAILYPHESPRRTPHFLVRKVCRAAVRIRRGLESSLVLGDLSAVRDWGYAPDYVEGMRLMLERLEPADYVIATGEAHSVEDVCAQAFSCVGLNWREHVRVDDQFKRGAEPVRRVGNAARARTELGWLPSLGFQALIEHIVDADRALLDHA